MSYKTYTRSQIKKFPAPKWLMKWMIQEGSLVRLLAQPNKGKSFMVLDWAIHMALGWDWYGYRVKKTCRVLYVAAEGLPIRRMEAWEKHYDEDIPDTLFIRDGMNISDADDVDVLKDVIEEHDIDVVIIDTQQRAGFEEGADAAGESINELDQLRAEFPHLAMVLVHHPGHANTSRGRGFSGYFGALDFEFAIDSEDPHELMTLTRTKQRDDGYFAPRTFYLKQIILGYDEDDDEISSCVMLEADDVREIPDTDKILQALKVAQAEGTEVTKSNVAKQAGIGAKAAFLAVEELVRSDRVVISTVKTRGRPKEVLIFPEEESGRKVNKPPTSSFLPLVSARGERK
jgi:hypothetical protein